jgi:hypothetical protein
MKVHPFHHPVAAVAPGQSAVFYDGDDVNCGGFIAKDTTFPDECKSTFCAPGLKFRV